MKADDNDGVFDSDRSCFDNLYLLVTSIRLP